MHAQGAFELVYNFIMNLFIEVQVWMTGSILDEVTRRGAAREVYYKIMDFLKSNLFPHSPNFISSTIVTHSYMHDEFGEQEKTSER